MGYQVYKIGNRYCGYGVPSYCEHPDCNEEIDRGLAFACGGEPESEYGCDRYFCSKHRQFEDFDDEGFEVCERCSRRQPPFSYKEEHPDWIKHLLTAKSWKNWRKENPEEVKRLSK